MRPDSLQASLRRCWRCPLESVRAADQKSAAQTPALTIYHIEGRRSERIVWLCEELGLPYKLEYKRGDVPGSMQTIREVSPLMPVAPTVRYGDQVIVESAGIIEMLLARHGDGRLRPAVDSPDYPTTCSGCTTQKDLSRRASSPTTVSRGFRDDRIRPRAVSASSIRKTS